MLGGVTGSGSAGSSWSGVDAHLVGPGASTVCRGRDREAQGNVRVLYSFPQKIGAGRVCYTAWEQVRGLHAAGATVTAFPVPSIERSLRPSR